MMTTNDLWILAYLVAMQKDKLRPEWEATLACEHYATWANDLDDEDE